MRLRRGAWGASFGSIVAVLSSAFVAAQATGPRLGAVNSEGMALRVDPGAGRAYRLSGVGLEGYANVQGLTTDEDTGVVYGVDPATHELVAIDWQARRGTPIGGIGIPGVSALAFDPVGRRIFGVEVRGGADDRLVRIDPMSGLGTVVGSMGVADVGGLAFDSLTGTLYATDVGAADTLLRVNTTTGASTVVGPLGFVFVGTLAFDSVARTLFGVDLQGDRVIRINVATGQGTALPSTLGGGGFTNVRGLAVVPGSSALVAMDSATEQLLTIDRTSGAGTALGPLGANDLRALAWDPVRRVLFATETRNDALVRLDLAAGQVVTLGPLRDPAGSRLYEVFALAYDPFRNRLYGADRLSRRLVVLDRDTGQATSAVSLRFADGQLVYGMRALGFDLATRLLYGIDSDGTRSRLLRIDPATGVVTLLGAASPILFPNVDGLVYSTWMGVLLASADSGAVSSPVRKLLWVHPGNGAWGELASPEMGRVYGLAYDPLSNSLGGTTGTEFYRIAAGGTATAIGALGAANVEGLAWDPLARMLYGTSVASSQDPVGRLFLIHGATGEGTPLAILRDASGNGVTAVAGLAWDPDARVLYGADTLRDQLVRINRLTGVVTVIGALGFQDVRGLAFHRPTHTLYGVDGVTDKLIRINTATGLGTAVGSLGFADVEGLGFDETTGLLYGSDARLLQLLRIQTTNGAATSLGSTAYKVDGLDGRIE